MSHLHSEEQNEVTRTGDHVDYILDKGMGRRGMVSSEGVAAGDTMYKHNTGSLSKL